MGLAETLGSMISAFDTAGRQNVQQDVQMQKIDVNNFWKQAQMTFDAGKFLTNTKIKLDNQDIAERKEMSSGYNILIDNITGQMGSLRGMLDKETNPGVVKNLRKQIEVLDGRLKNAEGVYEKWYPLERQVFDAGQAGYDVSGLEQEGNQLYGTDIDPKTLEGQKGGNGRQGGFDRATAPIRTTPSPVQMPAERHGQRTPERIPSGMSEMLSKDEMPSNDNMQDIEALKSQVQELIGQVQSKLGGEQVDSQPLDIPGVRQDIQPDIQPTAPTVAQREAEKYAGEQGIKLEQEQYDRYLTGLTSKYKYLDVKGMSVEDEIKATETDILEKQKLIQWIEHKASTGRTRSFSPTDILGTGIQQLMGAVSPKIKGMMTKPKSVMTAWGKRYSTDTTAMERDIERAKIKIDELNQLSELYVPGGGIPSEAQEQINTGMTSEQRNIAQRRNKLYGAYRQ